MTWFYQGLVFDTAPEEYQGFVYLITNTALNRRYVGKKNFWSVRKLPPLKGKKNRRHRRVETDWQEYYGSNLALQQDVRQQEPHTITREILYLCANKNQMTYFEMQEQFARNVLLDPNYYNEYIGGRVTSKGLTNLK